MVAVRRVPKVAADPTPTADSPAKIEVIQLDDPGIPRKGIVVPRVHLSPDGPPADYHCDCRFCRVYLGELRRPDGSYYSRLERRKYYDRSESGQEGHVAKTPLHIARWAVQEYTQPGDWVLDPTAGAGTTLVEALVQGRDASGVELEFGSILRANVSLHTAGGRVAILGLGDARGIRQFLREGRVPRPTLVVNNPPYSGDQSRIASGGPNPPKNQYIWLYDRRLPNLAHMKEKGVYWEAIRGIYRECASALLPGGHFVLGIKDQMRNKVPDRLHERFCEVLEGLGLGFVGTALLRHYPLTTHLNTYERRYGVPPPYYQTISVFKKGERK
jgi:hypothetical protein